VEERSRGCNLGGGTERGDLGEGGSVHLGGSKFTSEQRGLSFHILGGVAWGEITTPSGAKGGIGEGKPTFALQGKKRGRGNLYSIKKKGGGVWGEGGKNIHGLVGRK